MTSESAHQTKKVPNWIWFFLFLPFGATSGFVTVTLGSELKTGGVSAEAISVLVAWNLLPHTWKFLWGPIADTTLTRKLWYRLANAISCVTIASIAFVPIESKSIGILTVLVFVNSIAISFLGMAVEGLMAHVTPREDLGKAAGWFQAGNLGGNGLGGGFALVIAEHVSNRAAFLATAGLLAACTLGLRLVPDVSPEGHAGTVLGRAWLATKELAKDVWKTIATRRGIVALTICFLPIGSGAAANLFSSINDEWNASPTVLALTTGALGGVVAAAGSLAGGFMSDRMKRTVAYALSGALLGVCAIGMAFSPRSWLFFALFSLVYNFLSGVAYSCFTALVLDVIGSEGAAATKYNVFASLSNTPITYMTVLLGPTVDWNGPKQMLVADAFSELMGISVLAVVVAFVSVRFRKSPAA
jgi:MFS family permease